MEEKILNNSLQVLKETLEFLKKEKDKDGTDEDVKTLYRMYLNAYAFKYNEIKREIFSVLSAEAHERAIESIEIMLPSLKEEMHIKKEDAVNKLNLFFEKEDREFVEKRINTEQENPCVKYGILYSISKFIKEILEETVSELKKEIEVLDTLQEDYGSHIKTKTHTGLHTVIPVKKEMLKVRIINKSLLPKDLFDVKEVPNESRIKKWASENGGGEAVEITKKDFYLKVIENRL